MHWYQLALAQFESLRTILNLQHLQKHSAQLVAALCNLLLSSVHAWVSLCIIIIIMKIIFKLFMQDCLQITYTNISDSQEMMHVRHPAILSVVLSHCYLLTPYSHVRAELQGNSTDFIQWHLFAGVGAKKSLPESVKFPRSKQQLEWKTTKLKRREVKGFEMRKKLGGSEIKLL